MLTTESLSHPLMVTIVFFEKCWGTRVKYEGRGAHVWVLQIGLVNELKELADACFQMGVNNVKELKV